MSHKEMLLTFWELFLALFREKKNATFNLSSRKKSWSQVESPDLTFSANFK